MFRSRKKEREINIYVPSVSSPVVALVLADILPMYIAGKKRGSQRHNPCLFHLALASLPCNSLALIFFPASPMTVLAFLLHSYLLCNWRVWPAT